LLILTQATDSVVTNFTGTWNSSFGDLRLLETDGYIIGDYANKGVILGKVTGNCASGTFVNGKKMGQFRFMLNAGGKSWKGDWAWHGGNVKSGWTASLSNKSQPSSYSNFSESGKSVAGGLDKSKASDGTYTTQFADLRLVVRDFFMFGDYGNRGIIAARWDGSNYTGVFTNKNFSKKVGWVRFPSSSYPEPPRSGEYKWAGTSKWMPWSVHDSKLGQPNLRNVESSIKCND
jgi:hypothetical protein